MEIKHIKTLRNHRVLGKKPVDKILYRTLHLKLINRPSCFEINCFEENQLTKKEFISFLRHTKKFFKEGNHNKILVTLSTGWNIDIEAWAMIVKMEFEKINFLKIAFVANSMHQTILFKHLEQMNFNIRVFHDKASAIQWLNHDLMTE
ncbi:MAG: hypothetical protein K0S32_4360 [Bacteroidetes bacterium]|nr:hypothetical protein [Bacteroidota bacterium]